MKLYLCKYCNNKSKDNGNYCLDVGATIENNKGVFGDVYYCLDCLDSYSKEYFAYYRG